MKTEIEKVLPANCLFFRKNANPYVRIFDYSGHRAGAVDIYGLQFHEQSQAPKCNVYLPCDFEVTKVQNYEYYDEYGKHGCSIYGVIKSGSQNIIDKTLYMEHFENGTIQLEAGTFYKMGSWIGIQGNTGNSSGNHVHVEIWDSNSGSTAANNKDYLPEITGMPNPEKYGTYYYYKNTSTNGSGGAPFQKPSTVERPEGGSHYKPEFGGGAGGPTEADMQAAQYAVQVGHENMAIAQGQRSAAYDYLQQARVYHPACLAQKETAEQLVRNTEVKLDALIAKTNREMAETDDWIAGRIESMRSEMRQSVGEFTSWLQEKLEAVSDRILKFESPVTGQANGLEAAFEDLHDLHRDGALTAAEYDALQLTAAEYDAKQLLAYEYDVKGKTKAIAQ